MKESGKISFTVSSIDCIACAPVFKRELQKIRGVKEVKSLVMMNVINVETEPNIISTDQLKKEIADIASRAGYAGKVVFKQGR